MSYSIKALPDQPDEIDPAVIYTMLTERQRWALHALTSRYGMPASTIGVAGATLMGLNDLWRSKRGVLPPIALTSWHRDEWTGTRLWRRSPLGDAVVEVMNRGLSA